MFWHYMNYVAIISSSFGLVTLFSSMYTAIISRSNERRRKRLRREITGQNKKDGILVVSTPDTVGMHIIGSVRTFIETNDELKSIPKELILNVESGPIDFLNPEKDIESLIEKFNNARSIFAEQGVDRIHFFCRAPVVVAAMLGALIGNTCPVICYHNKNGYRSWGLLKK